MYLVADDVPVPQIHDPVYYAQTASFYFSDDPFAMLPLHRPGLGMLAAVVGELGIPFKLFLDWLLIVVATWSGLVICRLTGFHWPGLVAAVMILLHPWFVVYSSLFMTEPLVSLLLLLLLLTSVQLLCRPFQEWSPGVALCATAAACCYVLTRHEFLLLAGFYGLIAVVFLYRQRRSLDRRVLRRVGSWRLCFLLIPLLAAWASMQMVRASHESRFGVAAMCATEARGLQDLMNALYCIQPQQEVRFVPVPRQTLAAACQCSPVLASHQSRLLDTGREAYRIAAAKLGTEGEVATWLNWHLIDCFGGLDRNTANQMRVAARHIRQALHRGDLPARDGLFPVGPLWKSWLPEVPRYWLTSWQYATWRFDLDKNDEFLRRYVTNSVHRSFFDRGLKSRGGAPFSQRVSIHAEAGAGGSQATSALILNSDNEPIAEFPVMRSADGPPQFTGVLDDLRNIRAGGPLQVRLVRTDATPSRSTTLLLDANRRQWVHEFQYVEGAAAGQVEQWIVSFHQFPPASGVRSMLREWLLRWPWAGWLAAGLLALGTTLSCRLTNAATRDLAWVVFVAVSLLAARSLYYSLIHAWLQWGLIRYVQPHVLVMSWCVVCGGLLSGEMLARVLRRVRAATASPDKTV
jgi:hypothetical protein